MDNVFIENLIKLGMAVLVGGVIGAEREFQDKAAGFRTIILITIGSTSFTLFSLSMDPGFTRTRIAAPKNHLRFVEMMLKDTDVKELDY